MSLTTLGLATDGYFVAQGPLVPEENVLRLVGTIRGLDGVPLRGAEVRATLIEPPHLGGALIHTGVRRVYTDADGAISTDPNNTLDLWRGAKVRLEIPAAGLDWLVAWPLTVVDGSGVETDQVGFDELAENWLIEDLGRA